jgi:hypothetical protein
LVGLGDSYTSDGGKVSYPLVAANLLSWSGSNSAVPGSKMNGIPSQLAKRLLEIILMIIFEKSLLISFLLFHEK